MYKAGHDHFASCPAAIQRGREAEKRMSKKDRQQGPYVVAEFERMDKRRNLRFVPMYAGVRPRRAADRSA